MVLDLSKMNIEQLGKAITDVEKDTKWWLENKEQVLTEYQFRLYKEKNDNTACFSLLQWLDKNTDHILQKRIEQPDKSFRILANYHTHDGVFVIQWNMANPGEYDLGRIWKYGSCIDFVNMTTFNTTINEYSLTVVIGKQSKLTILAV